MGGGAPAGLARLPEDRRRSSRSAWRSTRCCWRRCSTRFTVFTALSIFGVFLGTAAPIIALSVMSGFENDLKTKIRSTKADVVIEMHDDRPFTDWQAVDAKLAGIPGIAGSMAYVEAEVIVKHATNAAGMGIVLRGIEPGRAPHVLGHRADVEGREGLVPRAPGTDPVGHRRAASTPDDDGAARRRRACCPASCWARSCTSTSCACSSAARSTSPARCAAWARSGPMPKLKPFRVAGHFYTGHVRVRFQAGLRRRCATRRSSWTCRARSPASRSGPSTPEAARGGRRRRSRAGSGPATRSDRGRS